MQRNLEQLANSKYDILVVGGGIYGACVAWEAVSRGLSVALVEKGDFGAATSANSLKIIHGGLRYLQHADFKRMRESIRERKALLNIAPHLVHPLSILVPTYGHGLKGREAMSIALLLNDFISSDRNRSISNRSHHIPSGKVISRSECLEKIPDINPKGLTGGAFFTDAQVFNSERLTLAFLQSAYAAGAQLANYAKVTSFLRDGQRIIGARVLDIDSNTTFDIRAQLVINTAGPWTHEIQELAKNKNSASAKSVILAKAVNLIIPKVIDRYAVGLSSHNQSTDQDALLDKGNRFLFKVPWRHTSMIGTWYFPYEQSPDSIHVSDDELRTCVDDINSAYPTINLSTKDIDHIHCGLLPSKGISSETGDVQLSKHYQIVDHRNQGYPGLLTVLGVKYTTARDVAEKAVSQAAKILNRAIAPSQTHQTPVHGGHIRNFEQFEQKAIQQFKDTLSSSTLKSLLYNYGTEYPKIIGNIDFGSSPLNPQRLLAAQVKYSIRTEMALHLEDIVLRRTDIGSAGEPEASDIELCADIVTHELGWTYERRQDELKRVYDTYAKTDNTRQSFATVSGIQ
jgi:glycerol-3-phosphate dehydrogenase